MKFWHNEKFGIILTLVSSALLLIFVSIISLSLVSTSPEKQENIERQITEEHQERQRKELQSEYKDKVTSLISQIESNTSTKKSFSQVEEFLFKQDVPQDYLDQHLSAAVDFKNIKQKYSSDKNKSKEVTKKLKNLLSSIIE